MRRSKVILAIDQGTTNTKVITMTENGSVTAAASRPVAISFPRPGWVEQDPLNIWDSVTSAISGCLASAGNPEVAAIGVSNQRESAIVWDRVTGKPVGPCITWQCRRTSGACDALRGRGVEAFVRGRSGLTIDPMFSATKFAWLISGCVDGAERAKRGELCVGTVDSWLLWKLTGGTVHATDCSNASRTQLFNIEREAWDPELADLFGVPVECLPEVRPSSCTFGVTHADEGLPGQIPVASLIGDSHAALFGHAGFRPGMTKATYGTGSSLMTLTDRFAVSGRGVSSTVAWKIDDRVWHAVEGNITNTGATVQWLGNFLGLADGASGVASIADSVPDTGGVYFVPAFTGMGAPHWDSDARGLICGLTRGATAAHVSRAAIESIAFQIHDVMEAVRLDTGIAIPALLTDGGASRNATLMQFQADILNCPVLRSRSEDLSARGAAWLAGLATGIWNSLSELEALDRPHDRFEPCMEESRRQALLAGWNQAVDRARSGTASER